MNHDILGLPSFSVIGLEANGPTASCFDWVPKLWAKTLPRAKELEGMKIEGCWGLMSDSETFLAPWKEQGRYLAGWQVPRETEPFSDWKVWTLPASAWLRIQLRLDQYDEAFSFMTQEFFPNNPWVANGACHEFYPNDFCNPKTDLLYCCVPIAPNPG